MREGEDVDETDGAGEGQVFQLFGLDQVDWDIRCAGRVGSK